MFSRNARWDQGGLTHQLGIRGIRVAQVSKKAHVCHDRDVYERMMRARERPVARLTASEWRIFEICA